MIPSYKKILLFIGLTFFISWTIVILYFAMGGRWGSPGSIVILTIYMFIPMTVVILIHKFIYREPMREPLGISFRFNQWFIIAWLLPCILSFLTVGLSLLFPGVDYSPTMEGLLERMNSILPPEQMQRTIARIENHPFPLWMGLIMALVAGITVNAVAGFGEELGWRGFLQKELSHLGFWKSSIAIGLIWGIWHAPIVLQGHNYPFHPGIGVVMMTIWCILLGIIFSYIRFKSKSVIAVSILHGSINAFAGFSIALVKGGNDLLIGLTGLAGFITLIFAIGIIIIYESVFSKKEIPV